MNDTNYKRTNIVNANNICDDENKFDSKRGFTKISLDVYTSTTIWMCYAVCENCQ